MIMNIAWLSLAKAAEFLDVSKDTVLRRAVEWSDEAVPGKVRTKYLVLGNDTRSDRRYYLPDLEQWLFAKPRREDFACRRHRRGQKKDALNILHAVPGLGGNDVLTTAISEK